MRIILAISFILFAQISYAQLPVGNWLNPQLAQDDDAFGKYYKGWLIISDQTVDQIITMGMHYDKAKLQILSDDGKIIRVFDKNENAETKIAYQVTGNSLEMCPVAGGCTTYQRTLEKPVTDPTPTSPYPQIQISTKWCVDNDCESADFTGIASEMLYNLNEGFRPVFWKYEAPEILFARHGIRLQVLSYSYRFSNNSSDLSSFMTSLLLVAEQETNTDIVARSGALVLNEGPLSRLQARIQGHEISLDFSIVKTK